MSVRLYLSPRVDDGRIHNVLRDLVPHLPFEEIRNDMGMVGLCLVDALDAIHAVLVLDPRVKPLCRLVASHEDLLAELDGPLRPAFRDAFAGWNVPTSGTLRQAASTLARRFVTDDVSHRRRTIDLSGRMVRLGRLSL